MKAQLSWWGALVVGLVAQSSLFPLFLPIAWRPDITKALVLWLALAGNPGKGPLLAFASGFILDAASGAFLGVGPASRLILYLLVVPFRGVFFDARPLLLVPFATTCAVAEALISASLLWLASSSFPSWSFLVSTAFGQAVVDAIWIPVVFLFLELASDRRSPRLIDR